MINIIWITCVAITVIKVKFTNQEVRRAGIVAMNVRKIYRNDPLDEYQGTQVSKYWQQEDKLRNELTQHTSVVLEVPESTDTTYLISCWWLNPLTPTVAIFIQLESIFDIWALWHSVLSPDVNNYKWRLNPVWHRILYSCTHISVFFVSCFNFSFSFSLVD